MPFHDAYPRLTPYERLLPSADFPERRFPAIRAEGERRGVELADPAAFALLQQATEALAEWVGEESSIDEIRQYSLLLFHAYHQHRAHTPVYLFETDAVRKLLDDYAGPVRGTHADSLLPDSLYLQLPQHLVWARPDPDGRPSSLDGLFRTVTQDGRVHVLPIGGLLADQPGFTVIPMPSAPLADEAEWLAADMRPGGIDFGSTMPGAEVEGLYEVTNVGEVLQLTARAVDYLRAVPGRPFSSGPGVDAAPRPSALETLWIVGEQEVLGAE